MYTINQLSVEFTHILTIYFHLSIILPSGNIFVLMQMFPNIFEHIGIYDQVKLNFALTFLKEQLRSQKIYGDMDIIKELFQ